MVRKRSSLEALNWNNHNSFFMPLRPKLLENFLIDFEPNRCKVSTDKNCSANCIN